MYNCQAHSLRARGASDARRPLDRVDACGHSSIAPYILHVYDTGGYTYSCIILSRMYVDFA